MNVCGLCDISLVVGKKLAKMLIDQIWSSFRLRKILRAKRLVCPTKLIFKPDLVVSFK